MHQTLNPDAPVSMSNKEDNRNKTYLKHLDTPINESFNIKQDFFFKKIRKETWLALFIFMMFNFPGI